MWLVRKALRRHGRVGAWKEERSHGRRVRLHHRLHPSADRQLDYQFQSASADATDDAVHRFTARPGRSSQAYAAGTSNSRTKGSGCENGRSAEAIASQDRRASAGRRSQESRRGLQSRAIGRSNRNPRARSLAPEQLLAFRRRLSVNHSSKPLAFPRRLPPFQRPQSLRRLPNAPLLEAEIAAAQRVLERYEQAYDQLVRRRCSVGMAISGCARTCTGFCAPRTAGPELRRLRVRRVGSARDRAVQRIAYICAARRKHCTAQ